MSKKFFGQNIEPACRCCAQGRESADGSKVFCKQCGVKGASDSCRRFCYDPLRRIPARQATLPQYEPADFEIDASL